MDNNDVRNRFRSRSRRDYVGPMPSPTDVKNIPEQQENYVQQEQSQDNYDQYTEQEYSQQEYSDQEYYDQEHYDQNYYEEHPDKAVKPKKSKKKKFLIFIVILIVLGGAAFAFWKVKGNNNQKQANNSAKTAAPIAEEPEEAPEVTKKTVRFVATGDMIAHDTILKQGKTAAGYDFSPMLANMKPYFDKSDVKFCNQATPAGGESFGYSGYPVFNAPLEWPRAIEGVGCNVMNIGTNHTNDKGQGLVDATVAAWDKREGVLAVVGANRSIEEQTKLRTFEKDGIKFAILSYSTYSNSPVTNGFAINMYDTAKATTEVTNAKKNADIVIVSMRWGTEYSPGIDATQDRVAQELTDAGADVIVGHGPHFLEPVKKLKGASGNETLVWFSLGNFLNTQLEPEALIGGFAIMDIDTTTKKITEPKFMPVYSHYEWTAAQKAANDLMSRTNVSMYPLDKAAEPMAKSQLGTTVEAQTDRVTKLLNTNTPVVIIKSEQF